jgi:hypothetical protein
MPSSIFPFQWRWSGQRASLLLDMEDGDLTNVDTINGRTPLLQPVGGAEGVVEDGSGNILNSETGPTITGSHNIVLGPADATTVTGSNNVALSTLDSLAGSNNVVIGALSGSDLAGSGNVFVGAGAGAAHLSDSNKFGVGTLMYGDFDAGTLGLNTEPSAAVLHVKSAASMPTYLFRASASGSHDNFVVLNEASNSTAYLGDPGGNKLTLTNASTTSRVRGPSTLVLGYGATDVLALDSTGTIATGTLGSQGVPATSTPAKIEWNSNDATTHAQFIWYAANTSGGGLTATHFQLYANIDSTDPQRIMDVTPQTSGGGVPSVEFPVAVTAYDLTISGARKGTVTANGTTPVVTSVTGLTANTVIILTIKSTNGSTAPGTAVVSAVSTGSGNFTVTSTAGDTAVYNWLCIG